MLHAFALPALVANLLVALREVTPERVAEFAEGGLPFLRAELMLRHSPDGGGRGVAAHRRAASSRSGLRARTPRARCAPRDRYSPEHAGLELLARSLRHLLRRNYLTIALLNQRRRRTGAARKRLEELMQMLTQRLSLLFEFAPPDFYERSTFASYIDTLHRDRPRRRGRRRVAAPHAQTRTWETHVERLLPADAVIAIRRVAARRDDD